MEMSLFIYLIKKKIYGHSIKKNSIKSIYIYSNIFLYLSINKLSGSSKVSFTASLNKLINVRNTSGISRKLTYKYFQLISEESNRRKLNNHPKDK